MTAPLPAETPAATIAGSPAGTGACEGSGPLSVLAGVMGSLDAVAGTDWHGLGGRGAHEVLDALEQVERRLSAVRSDVLSVIAADGLWALDGQRTLTTWLRERTDTTAASASKQVRQARALRDHLPLTRAALAEGTLSDEHVAVLVREAIRTARQRAQLTDPELGEAFLVAQAKQMNAGMFADVVKAWAIGADPEAADRAWRDAGTKEEFTIARTLDGYHLAGWLDELSGDLVRTALAAYMGRKAKDDQRTPAQRRAAALVALAQRSLDRGEKGVHARVRPHITVTVAWTTLRALAAATGSVVPPERSNGEQHRPGSGMAFDAESGFTAPGGSREPGSTPGSFELSEEARRWIREWKPGDEHVISAALDPKAMIGAEPATFADGTPMPPALLARVVCSSGLTRVVFGPGSKVLDVGRAERIFPAHMVKAIVARDRHCQYPGCDEPPSCCEVHHSLQWYRDTGPTDVEHGVLLCWHHHTWVHAQGISIVRSAGKWYFHNRHGWLITA